MHFAHKFFSHFTFAFQPTNSYKLVYALVTASLSTVRSSTLPTVSMYRSHSYGSEQLQVQLYSMDHWEDHHGRQWVPTVTRPLICLAVRDEALLVVEHPFVLSDM